ncbi:MAG: hypothetical protein K2O62_02130, partial [Clostridia bacterium]|nr:hypothetical protein [Clostridia bacterium]
PVIDKGTLDISAVKLNGNGTGHTYDGTAQKIEATGDVKDSVSKQVMSGVNLVYTYTKNGQTVAGAAANGVTDAGVYTVTLTFTHSNPNYNEITATREATLTINKASFDVSAIKLEVVSPVTYADGVDYTPAISGGEVPSEVTVNYEYDGTTQTTPFTFTNAGTYTVNVTFTHNNANYNDITKTLSATLKIEQADYPGASGIKFENKSASVGTTLSAEATNVPDGVTVTYVYNGKEQNTPFEFTELNESGYEVVAKFTHSNPNYKAIGEKTAVIKISHKPVYNESGLAFVATGAEGSGTQFTATYDPAAAIDIALTGSVADINGASVAVTVEYLYEKEVNGSWQTVSKADLCNAGKYRITASISTGDDAYAEISNREVTLEVAKANYVINVDFDGDTVVYDGDMHGIAISGTLPDGVEAVYTVTNQSATQFADAGTYEYTVSFTHNSDNYNDITKTLTATLTIEQADYPEADKIEFKSQSTSLGLTLTAEVKNVPDGVTVTYEYDGEERDADNPFVFAELNLEGYVVVAKFAHTNPNYKAIADREATFVIGAKPQYDEDGLSFVATGAEGSGTQFTAVYNPNVIVKIELTGTVADQSGTAVEVSVEYLYERCVYGEWVEVSADELKNAGEYRITASISTGNDLYEVIEDRTVTLTIEKAEADLSGVTFENVTVTYDGETHTIALTGTLPGYVTVEYLVDGEAFEGAVDMGTYTVTARFTVDLDLYEQPEDMTAVLKIDAKAYDLTGITFENATFVYDGEAHSIFIGGIELPDWITVSYTGNEVSAVGTHPVTAKFAHDNENFSAIADMTAQIVITKAKVALPVYTGTLSYTGDELKPAADDFEGFDSALMAMVDSKTVAGLNAGTYKAVFALKDGDSYEWATATTLKKALLSVAVYDGALADNEAAVEWTLAKAKISAVSGADGKPVFKSDGISAAALAQAVGLKFFADEACTQEIAADKLAYETTYYMQAELLDKTNFELDKTVTDVVGAPYTT